MAEEKIFDIAPGEKYEDNRSRFTIFFQVLGRKFWKLININLMFILFNFPSILVSLALSTFMVNFFMPAMERIGAEGGALTVLFVVTFPVMMFLMAVPAVSFGPSQAGMTYLLRCFSYESPTFIWSDFKDKIKENLKQGIIVGLINLLMTVFILFDLYLYSRFNSSSSFLFPIANGLLLVVFLIFLMMNLYIYPMMVTYELKLKDLYKNALLFAFARFLPNLGILVLCFILILAPVILIQFTASVMVLTILYAFYILLGFSLPGYIINFFVNPVIDKYLMPKEKDASAE